MIVRLYLWRLHFLDKLVHFLKEWDIGRPERLDKKGLKMIIKDKEAAVCRIEKNRRKDIYSQTKPQRDMAS